MGSFILSRKSARSLFLVASLIVGISSLFYLYEFFLRVAPSSMTHELMRDFKVGAGSIGAMSGFFFFAYAPMQIPVGVLCDRYGPKVWLVFAALCCGISTLVFADTNSIYVASISRFFIGLASAFAFVGPLVMATRWFAEKHLSTIAGLIQVVGCLGAIFAGSPISQLIESLGWRTTMLYSGYTGILLALIFLMFLKDEPKSYKKTKNNNQSLLKQLKKVFANPHTWWLSVVAFCCWAPISIFAELWGTSFLMTAYHASKITITNATIWVWVGIALGSLVAGGFSNKLKNRKKPIMILNIIGLFAASFVIFYHFNSWLNLDIFLFLLGFAAGIQPLTFGIACEQNPKDVHGAAMGVNNMAVIAGGVFLQPLIGFLLDLFWDNKILDGAPIYKVSQYQYAFIIIIFSYVISMLVTKYKIKETHCMPYSKILEV